MARQEYIIAKNPKNNLWYVLGFCGKKFYMPISIGYKTKLEAEQYRKLQPVIDLQSKIAGAACI